MKKLSLAILSALLVLAPVSAFEWGGLIDNTTQYVITPSAFSQSDAVYLWASSPLNADGSIYLKGEGMYKFALSQKVVSNIVDLDLLKCAGSLPMGTATLDFSAGRFSISDLTGAIFSQTSDGAYVNYAAPKFGVSAYAGYTGLLNANTVYMIGKNGKHAPKNKVYALANPYIPVSAAVTLPYLFLNQTLAFQGNAFIDLSEAKYNRIFGTMNLSGALAPVVFYNFATSFGSDLSKGLMNYSKLTVTIIEKTAMINVGVEYASGNNGPFTAFNGLSTHTAYSSGNGDMETTGLFDVSVGSNIPFGRNMLLGANLKGVFTCPESTVTAAGIQADVSFLYNILSDVQLTALVSDFARFNKNYTNKLSATLKLAVSF